MKTERRHELQTNTLANSLGEGIEKVRPYTNHILLGVGGAIVLLLAVVFFRSQAHAKQAKAWEAYFVATTPSETSAKSEQDLLRDVVKDFGDTDMADWAKLTIGDEGLNTASQLITTNKSEARKNLNASIAEYKPLGDSSKVPQVRNLANYNLGLCYEMLGDIDNAVSSYRKVNGTMATMAKQRADALEKNTEVRDFYEWFADIEPAARDITGGGTPGQMPPFKVDDPGTVKPFSDVPGGDSDDSPIKLFPEDGEKTGNPGDVKLPGLGIDSPETPATTPAEPEGTESPEKPATPEAGDAPAEKPESPAATDTPAEEAKPEGEAKPADEEKPAEASATEPAVPAEPAKSE